MLEVRLIESVSPDKKSKETNAVEKVEFLNIGEKIWQTRTDFRNKDVEQLVICQYDRALTLLAKAINCVGKKREWKLVMNQPLLI